MRTIKTLLLILFVTLSLSSYAQQKETVKFIKTKTDTTLYISTIKRNSKTLKFKGMDAIMEYNKYQKRKKKSWDWQAGHWQGVGLNYSGLVGGLNNLHVPTEASWMSQGVKSIGVDLNLIDAVIFSKGCFGIITGLGLEINNFRFDKNVGITNDENGRVAPDWSYRDAGIELSKSKLTTTYLQIPLLFEFKLPKHGWVNFGVVGGLLLQAHTKVKSDETGIIKGYRGLNMNNFHYGFEVGFGYSFAGVRAKYYPQSIFRPGEGPNVQQVSVGISVTF